MSIVKQISRPQHNIAQFDIVITLLSAREVGKSRKKLLADQDIYLVELQRGPQLIKSMETKLMLNTDGILLFEQKIYHKFRSHNRKTLHFGVSIYKESDRMFERIDTFNFDILKAFSAYSHQLSENATFYSNLLNKKNNEELQLKDWQAFKNRLSKSRQYLASSSQSKSIEVRYSIQIINQLDAYVQNEVPKHHLKTKKSNVSKRSSSSRNSRNSRTSKYVNKQPSSTSTLQKSDSRGALEQKFILPPLRQFYHAESNVIHEDPVITAEPKQLINNHQHQVSSITPLPVHSILKKCQNLSDIIEASYQGQSNLNKSERKPIQMPQIQEQALSNIESKKRNSQLIKSNANKNSQLEQFRRINSLPFKNYTQQKQFTPQTSGGTMMQQENYQFQSKPQQTFAEIQFSKKSRKSELFYLIMLMLLCIGFGWISYSKLQERSKVKEKYRRFQLKKSKIQKPKYYDLNLNNF